MLPQNYIKNIDGFDKLSAADQKALINDPANLQPMVLPTNCSKGCKVEFDANGGWETWGGEPISPAYKAYVEETQKAVLDKIEKAIKKGGL